jgi:hypothetical protein
MRLGFERSAQAPFLLLFQELLLSDGQIFHFVSG